MPVFTTLRAKLFLLVGLLLMLVAAAVLLLTRQDAGEAMVAAEARSMANVLRLVELSVAGRYRGLVQEKVAATDQLRQRLATLAQVIVSGLARFKRMEASGQDGPDARAVALDWLGSLRQGDEAYVVVYDDQDTALAHPDPALVGQRIANATDIKGRSVSRTGREESRRFGHAWLSYKAPSLADGRPVSRFAIVAPFEPWGWTVAVSVSLEVVEKAMEARQAEIVAALAEHMPRIAFAGSGFVFVFNGKGELVVPPRDAAVDYATAVNALTGEPLLRELARDAAHADAATGQRFFAPRLPDGSAGPRMRAGVTWFKALDWHIVACAPEKDIHAPALGLTRRLSGAIALVFALGGLLALLLAARLARPLTLLAAHAVRLPETDFTAPAPVDATLLDLARRRHDEAGRLAQAFLSMEEALRQRIQDLMRVTAAKERIQSELSIAREIQLGLLPKIFPPYPARPEFSLHAALVSAREVGGDLYDFAMLDDQRLLFTIGDVSGKGVPAALFMAIAKTLVKGAAERHREPASMMERVNDQLAEDNPNAMFVTLVIGVLDVRTGEILYVNAGHNPPALLDAEGARLLPERSGPLAGFMPGLPFAPLSLTLAPGQALLLYTDGVTEAMNAGQELFGEDRLLATLAPLRHAPAGEVVQGVMQAVTAHADGEEQSDDITMLCLRYHGPQAPAEG